MSAAKTVTIYGLRLALESTYATEVAPTDADYIMPIELPAVSPEWINDGERGQDARSANSLERVRKSGLAHTGDVVIAMRGNPAAYSGSNFPLDIHPILRISGHSATAAAGAVTYAPISAGYASATLDRHTRAQRYRSRGNYASKLVIKGETGGIVTATASLSGIGSLPVDQAMPDASAYNVSHRPMKFDGSNLSSALIGSWVPVIKSFEISIEMEITARPSGNEAGAHAGFTLGTRQATVALVVEAAPLATYDPYVDERDAAVRALDLRWGTNVAGQRAKFTTATAQLTEVSDDADGAVALWNLTYTLHGGADGNSVYSLIFD